MGDFEHFSEFKPAHEAAKLAAQVRQFQKVRQKAASEGREPTRAELLRAQIVTNATSMQCAKRPWEEAFSEDRIKSGWANEGVVPFTRKLMWELRAEEEASGIKPSRVPDPDVTPFGLPALAPAAAPQAGPSTAIVPAGAIVAASGAIVPAIVPAGGAVVPTEAAWDDGIDEEVEELLQKELGDPNLQVAPVPPPARTPKLTASLLFKLPGGASGPVGRKLIRSKEVERRLGIARAEHFKNKKAGKKAAQTDSDLQVAADALEHLKAKSYDLGVLKKEQLLSLVRVLQVGKAQGNKPALKGLLVERFGNITAAQFEQIHTSVHRGLAVAALPAPPPAPLQLPAPAEALGEPPAPAVQEQLPLAQRRTRR